MSRELITSGHVFKMQTGSGSIVSSNESTVVTGYAWGSHKGVEGYEEGGYFVINPSGHTYMYDIVFSNTSGSLLYIGFERYDSAKTSTSNNSCTYVYSGSQARNNYRIKGIVNLATDSLGSPTKYVKLRILNNWNSASGSPTSSFFHISLREIDSITPFNIEKNGIINGDSFREGEDTTNINKNGIIDANEIKEI